MAADDPLAALLGDNADRTEHDDRDDESINPEDLIGELLLACKNDNFKEAKKLLSEDVPASFIDQVTGWSPLHWAAYNCNVALVVLLIGAGASADYKKATAAAVAAAAVAAAVAAAAAAAEGNAAANSNGPSGGVNSITFSRDNGVNDYERSPIGATTARPTTKRIMQDNGGRSPLVNTPLHWAAYMGNLRITWILLQEGYSPNDVDETGNTPTHLAASNGRAAVLDLLLADGADVHIRNHFRNRPYDVAQGHKCKDLLKEATFNTVPLTKAKQQEMHAANLRRLKSAENDLQAAVLASHEAHDGMNAAGGGQTGGDDEDGAGEDDADFDDEKESKERGAGAFDYLLHRVEDIEATLAKAEELAISGPLIEQARLKISRLQLQHRLELQLAKVAAAEPILTQTAYTSLVNVLEQLLEQAADTEKYDIAPQALAKGAKLVARSHSEYWLHVAVKLLSHVECAADEHEKGIAKLEKAVVKANECGAFPELVRTSTSLLNRLQAEVEVGKRRREYPTVRLPPVLSEGQKMPKDWWKEEDTGHIQVTDEFPLPPKNSEGVELDYIWVPSDSLQKLRNASARMAQALKVGAEAGANEALLAAATVQQTAAAKTMKILDVKDAEDKEKAVTVASKAAKKLRKKTKKGKGGTVKATKSKA